MPYLIGPNSEAITPNRNSAMNSSEHRMHAEAEHRDEGNADLGELEPPRHHRLVVAVGEFAAERGQKEIGRDEDRGGERDQRLRVGAADVEQDEKDQGVLEEIVAEGRKELGPEQRREAPRQEQGRGHGGSGGWIGRGGPNDYRDKLRLPTGAKGLKDDNLGKRTIGRRPDREATGNPCKRLVWR